MTSNTLLTRTSHFLHRPVPEFFVEPPYSELENRCRKLSVLPHMEKAAVSTMFWPGGGATSYRIIKLNVVRVYLRIIASVKTSLSLRAENPEPLTAECGGVVSAREEYRNTRHIDHR